MKKVFSTLIAGLLIASFGNNSVSAQDAPGWAVGGGVGIPVYKSEFYESAMGFGLMVQTPYSFAVGPLNLGVGAFIGMTSGKAAGKDESWVEVIPTLNMAVNDLVELPMPIGLHAGIGLVPTGLGLSGGASTVLMVQPVVVSAGINAVYPLGNASDTFASPAQMVRLYFAAVYPLSL
jgi:hypothetical protein